MRKPATYPTPGYRDPNDKRMVQIIKRSQRAQPRAVNILGIPFDGAVLGRRGAAGGPEAIRQAMTGFSNYSVELGMGISGARVFDLGDLVLPTEEVSKAHRTVEKEVAEDLKEDSLLVLLGGDNSISLPSIRAFSGEFGDMGLVVVDSHLDLRGKIGGKATSGSAYGLAIQTVPGLDSEHVVEIGVHGFLNSEVYVNKANKIGITLITANDVRRNGARKTAEKAAAIAGTKVKSVYLSIDLDVVDASEVSGVSAPSAGGLSSLELFELILHLVGDTRVRCVDFVELAPSLDPTGTSPRIAAAALMNAIAGFQSRLSRRR